ncbi:MAG: vanadium-dependent haloperoxidase [Prosthecobacter sp.]
MHFKIAPRLTRRVAAGLLLLGWSAPVRADVFSDALFNNWNSEIYNAVEGISGQHQIYSHAGYTGPSGTASSGASMQAAAASAAYTILQGLYSNPSGSFGDLYSSQLSSLADDQAKLDGINFGILVANDILNWRNTDGASNPALYTPVGSAGYWATIDPLNQAAALPGWGSVGTFAIAGTASYTGSLGMSNPDYLTTNAYATDYNSVKTLGSASAPLNVRSAAQTDAAFFWNGAAGTITNAGLWNEVAKSVVSNEGLNLADAARLYAALNITIADTAIVTWKTKFDVDLWSPVTAITNGSADGNADTVQDSNWVPLLDTPNYPAYFAEQAALAAAAAGILESFAGSGFAFSLGSDTDGDGLINLTTNFSSLGQARDQAIMSGVWGGTYMPQAGTDAAVAGDQIATFVLNNNFAAVPEPSGLLLVVLSGLTLMRRRRCRA